MAAKFSVLCFNDKDDQPFVADNPTRSIHQFINFLQGVIGGARKGQVFVLGSNGLESASGTLTLEEVSGTVGGSINGVSITVETGESDEATATALAVAINASTNPLIRHVVTASAANGVVTITAVEPGPSGNWITLAASGTGVTASGARLTGGAGGPVFAIGAP